MLKKNAKKIQFRVRDSEEPVFSLADIKADVEEIIAWEDQKALAVLLKSTDQWKLLDKSLIIRIVELQSRPIKVGRKRLPKDAKELMLLACMVSAESRGISYSKRWALENSSTAPTKPRKSLEEAKASLRLTGSVNDYHRKNACRAFGIINLVQKAPN